MRSVFKRFSRSLAKMKRKSTKSNKGNFNAVLIAIAPLIFVVIAISGCANPQPMIKEVSVPTPCEVSKIPQEPKELDLENATISAIQVYITQIVAYAKEIRPIMRECVREKRIKAK